jgi:serine/threonine protein kinase
VNTAERTSKGENRFCCARTMSDCVEASSVEGKAGGGDDGGEAEEKCYAALCAVAGSTTGLETKGAIERLLPYIDAYEYRDLDYESKRFAATIQTFVQNHVVGRPEQPLHPRALNEDRGDETPRPLQILLTFLAAPECTDAVFQAIFVPSVAKPCFASALRADSAREANELVQLLHAIYLRVPAARPVARQCLGALVHQVAATAPGQLRTMSTCAFSPILCLVGSIVRGFRAPLSGANRQLLSKYLVNLHEVPGKISHEEPLLAIFHEPLVFCIKAFLDIERKVQDTGLLSMVLQKIVSIWPSPFMGNSPKEILLLHELAILLKYATASGASSGEPVASAPGNKEKEPLLCLKVSPIARSLLFSRVAQSISSDHSYIVQAALRMWRPETGLLAFFRDHIGQLGGMVVRPLLSNVLTHWNDTVRRQGSAVLKWFLEHDEGTVLRLGQRAYEEMAASKSCSSGERCDSDGSTGAVFEWVHSLIGSNDSAEGDSTEGNGKKRGAEGSVGGKTSVPQKLSMTLFDLVFGDDLGKGSYASVRYAKKIARGTSASSWDEFAVKQISKDHEAVARREISVMNQFSHPNVTSLIASFESKTAYHLVIEYAKRGDLHGILASTGPLTEESVQFLSGEILNALKHIHDNGYVYGDLKPENVLVHETGHVKLGDFGAARPVQECVPGEVEGTAIYLAPEILKGGKACVGSDYWALGCLVFQALAGRPPGWAFLENQRESKSASGDCGDSAMDEHVSRRIVRFSTKEDDAEFFPAHFTTPAKHLVTSLLQSDLGARYGHKECALAQFYSAVDLDTLHLQKPIPFGNNESAAPLPGGLWKRRMFSLVQSPVVSRNQYNFSTSEQMPVIDESPLEANASWVPVAGSLSQFGLSGMKKIEESANEGGGKTSHGSQQRRTPAWASSRPRLPRRSAKGGRSAGSSGSRGRSNETKRNAGLFVKGLDLTAG